MYKTTHIFGFLTTIYCLFNFECNVFAQTFDIKQFEKNLYLSQYLLQKQPDRDTLLKNIPKDYKIDSISPFNYYFRDKFNQKITVYLHIESLKIVYIELFDKQENYKDLKDYLIQKKKFVWNISEHNCDYLNNKKFLITICPGMKEGVMIHISLYDV